MSPVSRGFRGWSRAPAEEEGRLPPGQHVTTDFPVLSAGPTPHTPLPEWTFSIIQDGDTLKSWTWQEMQALPAETVTVDIHCVTRWSKLGTHWRGVSVDTLLDQVAAEAPYVLAFCDGGYTTNLPAEDVTGGKAWVAFGYDGATLEPEHGGPARLLVPPDWPGHLAGQHLDVRLTAEDGYRLLRPGERRDAGADRLAGASGTVRRAGRPPLAGPRNRGRMAGWGAGCSAPGRRFPTAVPLR